MTCITVFTCERDHESAKLVALRRAQKFPTGMVAIVIDEGYQTCKAVFPTSGNARALLLNQSNYHSVLLVTRRTASSLGISVADDELGYFFRLNAFDLDPSAKSFECELDCYWAAFQAMADFLAEMGFEGRR